MILEKLAYFAFSGFLFAIASYRLRAHFKNADSFFYTFRQLLKNKTDGSIFLAITFANILFATSLFFISNNTN